MASSPPILYLQGIALTYGVDALFQEANLSISPRDRLCLVGRNGSGKSTLLKIAAGLVEFDSGKRFVQPQTTIEYLEQTPNFEGFTTIGNYVLAELQDNESRQKAHQIMADLRLNVDDELQTLSGGEQRRTALAKVMAPEPDILLLDEPTNHLDLPAIEWLEQSLRQLRSALVLISHDRRFLSNLSKQTLWVDRGQTRLMKKGFHHFEDWRDKIIEEEEEIQDKLKQKILREEHWVRHGVSGRRKRNQKRMSDLGDLRQKKQDYKAVQGSMNATVVDAEKSGKLVIKADDICKSFDGQVIVDKFSTIVKRGNHIGIVGANGAGKSTLLKMLTGELEPDSGNIKLGKNLEILTLDQNRSGIKKDWTVKDALTDGAGDLVSIGDTTMHVIGYMKEFLFHPSQMRTPVTVLSGGELARLLLARGLRQPSNLLIMDEPTNDLDLETLDLLQEMIADYNGTVIVVSHDRDFLDRTVSSIFTCDNENGQKGQWIEYSGGYTDMLNQRKGKDIQGRRAVKTSDKVKQ